MKHIKRTTLILILNLIFIHYSMGQSSEENGKKDIVLLGAYQMHQADWSPLRKQYKVFNASVRDFSSQQLSWILDHSVFPYNPDWCIIHTGLEDVLIGVDIDRVILNVAGLFSTLKENGINVILMGALPNYTLSELQPEQIDALNDRLKKLAKNNGVPFIDTRSFDLSDFFQNNILLNRSGCKKWNNIILSELETTEYKKPEVAVKEPSSGFVYSALSKERIDRILSESPDEVKICFLGNSITEGGSDWNQKLNGKYIRNCGQGGYTTRQMSWLMEPTVLSVSPTHCFIMGGINDISLGISVDTIFNHYQNILAEMLENNIQPVVQSTLYQSSESDQNNKVAALNQKLNDWCSANEVDFLDINEVLSENGALIDDYHTDGTHLNEEGYKAWSNLLKRYLVEKEIDF